MHKKPSKQTKPTNVARFYVTKPKACGSSGDIPNGAMLSVKGRPTLDRSRYEQATRGTGQRWGSGIGPIMQEPQVWGYKLPSGRITYASTKPKGKAAAGWFKVE